MAVPGALSRRHRLSLSTDPARRVATWSLLMVAASAVALMIGSAVGTFLQLTVFDLEEQQLLSEAGAWGYVAAVCLVVVMVVPAVIGIVLGLRGRRLGERRLGTTGIVVNALITAYLVLTAVGTLLLG
jgi:amino acid transporter